MKIKLFFVRIFFVTVALLPILAGTALAETAKPNILVIWGDDIGTWNMMISVPGTSATTIAA
jgi:hypothetical protein